MRLTSVHITNYRCVKDSTKFSIDPHVTCLVGKNESGKTALLQALKRLLPVDEAAFDVTQDYPRVALNSYRRRHDSEPDVAVVGRFELTQAEVEDVEEKFGQKVLCSMELQLSRNYQNELEIGLEVDEKAFLQKWTSSQADLSDQAIAALKASVTIEDTKAILSDLVHEDHTAGACLRDLEGTIKDSLPSQIWTDVLEKQAPGFLYFGDYDVMRGEAFLHQLTKQQAASDPGLRTLLALLELADISPQELTPSVAKYEDHKARLESTANAVTDEVFGFWSQNRELEVEIDVTSAGPPPQQQALQHKLHVRIRNRRHRVTVPFDERSKGFVWFFSFLARFEQIVAAKEPVVLLLDEPGLSLHASAQADFLRFINERLAPDYQVVYTTHSPFMVEPDSIHRVRTVEDIDNRGTVVSGDFLRSDSATSFPLQAALGYSMAQTLFVGPNCLLVEGPSDLIYLQVMSALVGEQGGTPLSPKWVIVPVGGADRLAAFATLLGSNKLNIAVLMDFEPKDRQRLDRLLKTGVLKENHIVRVGELLDNSRAADIEDLFGEDLYIQLVNDAMSLEPPLCLEDLPKGDRIVKRVEIALKKRKVTGYNHFRPALSAIRLLPTATLPEETIARFVALFEKVNSFVRRR